MIRRSALVASACLALAAVTFAGAATAGPRPDLIITQFGLTSWGTCAPGKTVFTFAVTIKNQGAASWVGSSDVVARDLKNTAWFTSVAILPIPAGQSHTVQIPIAYLESNPSFMSSGSPHPFQAMVNDQHIPIETNFANNAGPGPATYMGKRVIMVAPPKSCGK
jgi:hypothetical protein